MEFDLFTCFAVMRLPMINSKQHEHNSAAAIASYNNSLTRVDCMLRDTMKRATAANAQQNAMKLALIASAVFMSLVMLASENIFLSIVLTRFS